jgi:GAF domain-containing protein
MSLRGFGAVYALPMRLREEKIGALNVFAAAGSSVSDADLEVGQALADVATIAVFHHRALNQSNEVAQQLQGALNSRIAIEQAKGVLAAKAKVDVSRAFALLRNFARARNLRLSDLAADIVRGTVAPETLIAFADESSRRPAS